MAHKVGVLGEPSGIDVTDEVVLEDCDAVVKVGSGLAVLETVEEPPKPLALVELLRLHPLVLEVSKVLAAGEIQMSIFCRLRGGAEGVCVWWGRASPVPAAEPLRASRRSREHSPRV